MATKEKKLSVGRKQQSASPVPPKESIIAQENKTATIKNESNESPSSKVTPKNPLTKSTAVKNPASLAKKLMKQNITGKRGRKKGISIKLKSKAKRPIKINQKLAKTLLNNAKELEKKKLLKNGIKGRKPRKPKAPPVVVKNELEDKDDKPPVLEPIFPIEDNLDKKPTKKRLYVRKIKQEPIEKKIKVESDDTLSIASDVTDTSVDTLITKPTKKKILKKIKTENATTQQSSENIEDVMTDLSFLIKGEIDNTVGESNKNESVKPKRQTKKQLELLKKKFIKKENIENTLTKLDPADREIIDRLDLNVRKFKRGMPVQKRRHSIEKFPIGSVNSDAGLSLFSSIPRSMSPRGRRGSKIRQSVDRRSSPYTTRSDSPARILRNGKHRKLKDINLLEGIALRKRKRLCSDLSGSEMSKLTDYESDGSFSDLASLSGADNESKDTDINFSKDEILPIKRSLSIEENNLTDTNSNLCDNVDFTNFQIKKDDDSVIKSEIPDFTENIAISPSTKVPEKSLILVSMKQTFNITSDDNEKKIVPPVIEHKNTSPEVSAVKFYGSQNNHSEEESLKIESEVVSPFIPVTAVENKQDDLKVDNIISELEEVINSNLDNNVKLFETETEKVAVNETETTNVCDKTIVQINESETDVATTIITQQPSMITEQMEINEEAQKEVEITCPEEKIFNNNDETSEKINEELICSNNETSHLISQADENISQINENNQNEAIIESGPIVEKEGDTKEQLVDKVDDVISNEHQLVINELSVNGDALNISESKLVEPSDIINMNLSPEELAAKEKILEAVGLQSLKAAEEAKLLHREKIVPKTDLYTGTLKTVIKINRDKKKRRNSLKMTLQKNKTKGTEAEIGAEDYKIMKEGTSTSWKNSGGQSSDTAGAHRKSHYYNRSNMDGSSEHTSDGESQVQEGATKALVIPEKASSFSIHPGRLCKDECSYCFGKFGLFDTPCHIAQMKTVERQDKILGTEKHLTRDSCLCDACYRHVDRKANTPSYNNKSFKRSALVAPGPRQNHCHVLGCGREATNILRRKWIIKMRKSVCQVINIDLDNPGLHSIPICDVHYSALEHLMVCAMCKRRLARNHIHYLGPEVPDLNSALNAEGIPLTLTDKPVVCKLCKCFANVILKEPAERPENSINFFTEYKRRLLHFNDIVPMDEASAEEPIAVPSKDKFDKEQAKKKKKINKNHPNNDQPPHLEPEVDIEKIDHKRVPSTDSNSLSRPESPSDYNMVDYNTLIPSIAMECDSDTESNNKKEKAVQHKPAVIRKIPRQESIKEAVEISKFMKLKNDKNSDIAVQRLGSNPSISVRQLFPGEEDLPVNASIDFANIKERTPEGWEKVSSVIQYDMETKHLWHELQKPYGNQSSFLRHLILLEKYFRNGDLVLAPNATHHSVNYSLSVHNRLKAYDNIPSSAGQVQPLSMLPFNKPHKSSSGIITSTNPNNREREVQPAAPTIVNAANIPKSTPITISQLNSPPLSAVQPPKPPPKPSVGAPPGLISLQPGTNRPVAPLVKVPQSQKIKFPITKNWRPNLIPIDPTKKTQERKAGLVQVISGGKPYHITLEDYKKMCAIKRSFELKQKRLQEAQAAKSIAISSNSLLKRLVPGKGLIISKSTPHLPVAVQKVEPPIPPPLPSAEVTETENILQKLDKQVEKLEAKFNEPATITTKFNEHIVKSAVSSAMALPKIPKSLTVIPQTVRKPSRPASPVLLITQKTKQTVNKS